MKPPARRLIEPPSRTSLSGTVFILLVTLLFSITPFSPCFRGPAALAAFLLMAAALLARQFQAFHYALLFTLIAAVPAVDSRLSGWPFALLVPLLLYVIAILPVSRLRSSLSWIRSGRLDRDILALVAATGLISGIGLYSGTA